MSAGRFSLDAATYKSLLSLMWEGLSGDDLGRWFRQEVNFTVAAGLSFGLR